MNISIVTSPDYFDFAELVAEFISDQRTVLRLTNSIVDKCNEVVDREVSDMREDVRASWQQSLEDAESELQTVYGQLRNLDKRDDTHEVLVNVCRTSDVVLDFVRNNQKINAIKEVRRLTNASLKASKDAVEDPRVWNPPMFEVIGVTFVEG